MARVRVEFEPDAAYVRLIRLIAAAVARRAGLAEEVVDEIKLAVGEACGLAVSVSTPGSRPVAVELDDTEALTVAVHAPADVTALDGGGPLDDAGIDGLAIVRGLLDDVEVAATADGSLVRMSWPRVDNDPAA